MKKIEYFIKTIICVLVFTACESFIADDINRDPNNPSVVTLNAVLPSIEIRMMDWYGGQTSRVNSMFSQQTEGVARQWSSFNQYTGMTPTRFVTVWDIYYEDILIEVNSMIADAQEDGYNHYVGIGQILKASAMMSATDWWGDIPNSTAALGIDEINPTKDGQASIYAEVFSLLDSGISLLNGSNGGFAPGSDDVIYKGDVSKWILAANAIKARGHLHLGDYASALSSARASFSSDADDMSYQYSKTQQAGWWRFNDGRTGDIEFHPYMRELMTNLNDTDRLAIWDQTFITSHPYMLPDYNQDYISYRETQFIIAECLKRTNGSSTDMETAYLNGIKGSFDDAGLTSAQYDAYVGQAAINPGGASLDLEDHILTQKYIGLFIQPEVFNDLRRNDFPALTPVSGSQIPVRWNYSENEILFNSNFTAGEASLFSPRNSWDNN
ncbi:MAG: SusD/RagB family nutrient-binding outer membrane lipoprotein [Flavobacteriaceae bacterium]|nr:SusD/RagB family nutrient-binding outer membrane lipoprotein [Flavobacteriaceae bacterium]